MVMKKSSLIIAAIATISLFLSVTNMSCTKTPGTYKYSCNNVVCSNGGYCDSARCICPVGYEGAHCEIAIVDKFIGSYGLKETILGSDSASLVNTDTTYDVLMRKTATPTTFFLDNFAADPQYSSIICTIDSMDHTHFLIDTTSRTNMVYDHYRIMGGQGNIYGDTVLAYMRVRHLTSTVNWQNDTLELRMYKKK